MELADVIVRDAVLPVVRAKTRMHVFQAIGAQAGEVYELDAKLVARALLTRERQGTTAMGAGVAVPHAQLPDMKSLVGLFARLIRPVDFQACDGRGVDLVFALLTPERWDPSRLCALAQVCRLLHDRELCSRLRQTSDADALYALITESARHQRKLHPV